MSKPSPASFQHYLESKVTVDDRALNRPVLEALAERLSARPAQSPLRILEVGAGIGSMVQRLAQQGLLNKAHYTALDLSPENLAWASQRLPAWAARQGMHAAWETAGALHLSGPQSDLRVIFEAADLYAFTTRSPQSGYDLLVAHAVLDLLDLHTALPALFGLLRPGGLAYFTLNYDGETIFEPPLDAPFEEQVVRLYHQTMDERRVNGVLSGHSQTGRRLFSAIPKAGGRILAAGASDWVVFPGPDGYPNLDADFLQHILGFFRESLQGRPELDPKRFQAWLEQRRCQVQRGELAFIAHQIDLLAELPEN